MRVPVAVAMILTALFGYAALDGFASALRVLAYVPYQVSTEYTLSVVPLFVLMGALVGHIGVSTRLYQAAEAMFGGLRGSSAMATIGASAAFGAISGSSLATTATIGKIAIPEMQRLGYSDRLATASVAAGGTLGILIPPSVILVVYALLTQLSIAKLFMAGLVPGIVLALLYVGVVLISTLIKPSLAPKSPRLPGRERLRAILGAWETVLLFGGTIGGIVFGIVTPTEAASLGVALALVIGLARRKLCLADFADSLLNTAVTSASIFFLVLGATFFSIFVVQAQIPTAVADWLEAASLGRYTVLLLMLGVYVVLGCFMDGLGMVLATLPVFFPVILSLGFDPIWFGVLVVLVVEIGLITPPVGMNLFVLRNAAPGVNLSDIYVGVWPFLVAQFAMIALLILWPRLSLWLPATLG